MLKKIVVLFQLQTSESFTVYVINVNVPRVRANADKCLQHHQGCPETPKSADVICERPLRDYKVLTSEKPVDKHPKVFQSVDVKVEERYCKYKWSLRVCSPYSSSPLAARSSICLNLLRTELALHSFTACSRSDVAGSVWQ